MQKSQSSRPYYYKNNLHVDKYEQRMVSELMKKQSHSELKTKEIPQLKLFDECDHVKINLKKIKNQLDDLISFHQNIESEQQRNHNEIQEIKKKEEKFVSKLDNLLLNKQQLQQRILINQQDEEKLIFQYKQIKQVKLRMGNESVFYKFTINNLEHQLAKLDSAIKIHKVQHTNKKQNLKAFQKAKASQIKDLNEKNYQMSNKINELENIKTSNEQALQNTDERLEHNRQLIIQTILEKSQEEKDLEKLFGANRFLSNFLNQQIVRLKKNYSQVDKCYQHIKSITGITQINKIVQKFINQKNHYQNQQQLIQNYETQLNDIQIQNKQLQKDFKEIQEQNKNCSYQLQNREQKQVKKVKIKSKNQSILTIERVQLAIQQFLLNNEVKIQKCLKIDTQFQKQKKYSIIIEDFKMLQQFITELLQAKGFDYNLEYKQKVIVEPQNLPKLSKKRLQSSQEIYQQKKFHNIQKQKKSIPQISSQSFSDSGYIYLIEDYENQQFDDSKNEINHISQINQNIKIKKN